MRKEENFRPGKLLAPWAAKPNTKKIGLENTKVKLDRGFIVVDANQQTAEPGVYGHRDVVAGTPQLATCHREGMIAVAHMAGKRPSPSTRIASPLHLYRARHRQRGAHRAQARPGIQSQDRPLSIRRMTAAPPSWEP